MRTKRSSERILLIYPAEPLSALLVRSNIAAAATAHPAVQTMGDQFPLLSSPLLSSILLFLSDILALGQESKILGHCWVLSEFHISSRSFSNQFMSTVFVCGVTPTNCIEGK